MEFIPQHVITASSVNSLKRKLEQLKEHVAKINADHLAYRPFQTETTL